MELRELIKDVLEKNGFNVKEVIYLNIFGETVYNIFNNQFAKTIHQIDQLATKMNLGIGTKIFIVAEKI